MKVAKTFAMMRTLAMVLALTSGPCWAQESWDDDLEVEEERQIDAYAQGAIDAAASGSSHEVYQLSRPLGLEEGQAYDRGWDDTGR